MSEENYDRPWPWWMNAEKRAELRSMWEKELPRPAPYGTRDPSVYRNSYEDAIYSFVPSHRRGAYDASYQASDEALVFASYWENHYDDIEIEPGSQASVPFVYAIELGFATAQTQIGKLLGLQGAELDMFCAWANRVSEEDDEYSNDIRTALEPVRAMLMQFVIWNSVELLLDWNIALHE